MSFCSVLFCYNTDEILQELNVRLYPLEYGKIGFNIWHFCLSFKNLLITLSEGLSLLDPCFLSFCITFKKTIFIFVLFSITLSNTINSYLSPEALPEMGLMWMRLMRNCSWQNPGAWWGSRQGMEGREARARYPEKSHRRWGQHNSVLQDSSGDSSRNHSSEEAMGLEYVHVFIPLVRAQGRKVT